MRILVILEVSQKQAYIFASNKLRENIQNSAVIAWVMSKEYFARKINDKDIFSEEDNYVYSGGGHVVLEFPDRESAVAFTKRITTEIHKDYPGIEVFAAAMEYEESQDPGTNLRKLSEKLERKKSLRRSAFHQGSFGVEKIDVNTRKPELAEQESVEMPQMEKTVPAGYQEVFRFEDLGGSKDESNFIAVVHIDGNAMGVRVADIYSTYGESDWTAFKSKIREFSESVDVDFKSAYSDMCEEISRNIKKGVFEELSLRKNFFPVRKVIGAGDDICYVAEGRIGIESAVAFINALKSRKNSVDGKPYAACAGVAIVHQKYPFYRAYELAEMLCSSAKRFGAGLSADQTGKELSCIDWHIEYGELKDTLGEIRREYAYADEGTLELRPYIVDAPDEILKKEPIRQYRYFKKLIKKIQSKEIAYARGKLKGLRTELKRGEKATEYYLKFNKLDEIMLDAYQDIYVEAVHDRIGTGQGLERKVYAVTADGMTRSLLFDAIEVVDAYIGFEE